jgi:CrcB protein
MESAIKRLCADDSYLNVHLEGAAMRNTILVGVGGFVGSILRYLISGYVQQLTKSAVFPYGTLFVNIAGCLVIGFLSQLADARGVFTAESRVLIFIGILGGFTTFSAFGNETMNLLREGENVPALLNIGVHVVFSISAVWAGRLLAYLIWR